MTPTDPASTAHTPCLAELNSLLKLKQKDENAQDASMRFFHAGLEYFVTGKAQCWWCNGKSCDAAMEMLHLFSIEENTLVVGYKAALSMQLTKCEDCIFAYYTAKETLRGRYCKQYDPKLVDNFFLDLGKWDARRIAYNITTAATSGSSNWDGTRIALIDALADSSNLLFHSNVRTAITEFALTQLRSGNVLDLGNRLLPGFLALCFSTDRMIRTWAWRSLKLARKDSHTSFDMTDMVFVGIFNQFANQAKPGITCPVSSTGFGKHLERISFPFSTDDAWHGIRVSLSRLSSDIKRRLLNRFDKLPVFICRCLLEAKGDTFVQALRAFGFVVGSAEKSAVWPQIYSDTKCRPDDFVLRIIDNPEFCRRFETEARDSRPAEDQFEDISISTHNNHLRPVLEWITPFIESLQLPKDHRAVIVLLEELLFKVRLNKKASQVSAAIATHTAMAIITHCLKLPTLERFMFDGKHLLSEFLDKHFHVIADIAQGRDDLSKSELLISGAEDLIDLVLREDLENAFKVYSEYNEVAQSIKDDPNLFEDYDSKSERATAPILIHFSSVWESVLKDPQNTNIVRKSLYAVSYLLLFDPIPRGFIRYLPQKWRDSYRLFEQKRSVLAILLHGVLQLLATGLEDVEPAERHDFEKEILSSQLRLLVSPQSSIHPIVLQILRISSLDLVESDSDGIQQAGDRDTAASARRLERLSDSDRDLVSSELFERHQFGFIRSLTDVVNNCKVLVSCNRPAFTCSSNIALFARSSISVVSDPNDQDVSEAVVRMFFAFCSLLGAILKANADDEMQVDDHSMYMNSVLGVFNAVYDMLNSFRFAGFVNKVKNSTKFNEGEAMDALSMCVSQMLDYLGGDDPLGVSVRIIVMLGLIASGLAATKGTSMLYPKETVDELIGGQSGHLTREMRTKLRRITSNSVWEARSIKVSGAKPVQIIFDDENDLSFMDVVDLSDVLDETIEGDWAPSKPTALADIPPRKGFWADLSTSNQLPNAPSGSSLNKGTEKTNAIQLTASDAKHVKQRTQMSLMDSMARINSKGESLTARLNLKQTRPPPSTKMKSKKPNSGSINLFDQVRSSYVPIRKDVQPGSGTHRPPPSLSKQVVKAPRSMVGLRFSTTAQRPADYYDPYSSGLDSNFGYIRDVSEVALRELEEERLKREQQAKSKQQRGERSLDAGSDDNDMSSSDESSGDAKRSSGLAGLIKIPKQGDAKLQTRRTMKMMSLSGTSERSVNTPIMTGGQYYNQEARDKALAEKRAKLRLNPNLNRLFKRLLGWRYEGSGEYPLDFKQQELQMVADTFADCGTYSRVFEPLLLLESWAQFQRAKEESESKDTGEATLESRTGVDDFQDITFRMTPADADMILDNDVLVFSEALLHEKRFGSDATAPGGAQRTGRMPHSKRLAGRFTFLAMVKKRIFGRKGAEVVVRVYFGGDRIASMMKSLSLNSCWEFINIYSTVPIQREYSALQSLEYLDESLVKEILCPRESLRRQSLGRTEVQQVMKAHALNQPQAEAVASAMKLKSGFTLIQGPPGTGKTKTIIGLAGALVSASKANADSGDDGGTGSSGPFARNKLLICAPSNAAVDEIVKRLKNGIRDNNGTTFFPRVVRIGQSDSISSTVRDTTLDFLLDKALNSFDSNLKPVSADTTKGMSDQQSSLLLDIAGQNRHEDGKAVSAAAGAREMQQSAQMSIRSLTSQLDAANDEIKELDVQMQNVDTSDTAAMRSLKDNYQKSKQKKRMITQKLVLERERMRGAGKAIDETRARVRMQILQKTDILCCTLSGSGHDLLTSLNCSFETVIIDEAAQSIELSCLIPLKYGCRRCILVGDPNQLPPTVFSRPAMQNHYSQSLFVRIQKSAPQAVNLLSIQYRMHPEISVFPSRLFYESRLQDGPSMAVKQRAPWHNSRNYAPFKFFDLSSSREQVGSSHSVFNMEEVTAAVQLVYGMCTDYPNLPWKQRIGIITPYKQQLRKLVEAFVSHFGENVKDAIEFNTVDGFQGQEKDVIIFSCVRAGEGGVGFLSDRRRMNVGLTRARKSLFVLGNAQRLTVSPLWRKLIDDARDRGLLQQSSLPLFGKAVRRDTRLSGLQRELREGESLAKADGEGDQSEFIMEELDEAALNRLNQRSAAVVKQASLPLPLPPPSQPRKPMDVDIENAGPKRKNPPAAVEEPDSANPKRLRLLDDIVADAKTTDRPQPLAPVLIHKQQQQQLSRVSATLDKSAQVAASREKQRGSLFIPRKRAVGQGSSVSAGVREPRSADVIRPASAQPLSQQQQYPPPHTPIGPLLPPLALHNPPHRLKPSSLSSISVHHHPPPAPSPRSLLPPHPPTAAPESMPPSVSSSNPKHHHRVSSSREDSRDRSEGKEKRKRGKHKKNRSSSEKSCLPDAQPKRKPGMFRPGMIGGGHRNNNSGSAGSSFSGGGGSSRRSKHRDSDDSRDDLISSMLR